MSETYSRQKRGIMARRIEPKRPSGFQFIEINVRTTSDDTMNNTYLELFFKGKHLSVYELEENDEDYVETLYKTVSKEEDIIAKIVFKVNTIESGHQFNTETPFEFDSYRSDYMESKEYKPTGHSDRYWISTEMKNILIPMAKSYLSDRDRHFSVIFNLIYETKRDNLRKEIDELDAKRERALELIAQVEKYLP